MKLIANPQVFQLNEIIFGNANFDVIKDMISQSIATSSSGKRPMELAVEMILQQKSFYPLLPNSVNSEDIEKIEKTITIDERKLNEISMGVIPDIFISPISTMQPLVKKISSTLFINPGYLIKNGNPGSFARITSYPPDVNLFFKYFFRIQLELIF